MARSSRRWPAAPDCTQGKKRFVIALKYPGESEYRFLVATDLSWRTLDILQTYTLRWLVEVFFVDWKRSEGWGSWPKRASPDDVIAILELVGKTLELKRPGRSAKRPKSPSRPKPRR